MNQKAKPTPKKGKGGRPTKYKKQYAKDIIKFFDVEPFKKEVMESSTEYFANGKIKKENIKHKLVANKLPTLFSFSQTLDEGKGIAKSTVLAWVKARIGKLDPDDKNDNRPFKYPEFHYAYNAIKDKQKEFLMNLGLSGACPPASFIFIAKNITDMRDKVEVPVDKDGNAVSGFIVLPQRLSKEEVEKKEYNYKIKSGN